MGAHRRRDDHAIDIIAPQDFRVVARDRHLRVSLGHMRSALRTRVHDQHQFNIWILMEHSDVLGAPIATAKDRNPGHMRTYLTSRFAPRQRSFRTATADSIAPPVRW